MEPLVGCTSDECADKCECLSKATVNIKTVLILERAFIRQANTKKQSLTKYLDLSLWQSRSRLLNKN